MKDTEVYAGVVAVGALTGIRSLSGPALASEVLPPEFVPISPIALRALAVGEFVADKLPFMPDRTSPIPLAGRAVLGGLSGAAIARHRNSSIALGAALGGAAAIGMAFVAFKVRQRLSKRLPGPLVGLAEDLVVTGLATFLTNRLTPPAIPV